VADSALSVVAGLLVVGGVALVVVGALGWRRRLPRNRFAGVRTVHTLRDDETFAVGNQVAAPLCVAAGLVAVLGGFTGLGAPSTAMAVTLMAVAGLGAAVLTVAGGVLGDRAAGRVPLPAFTGCGGACGCCERAAQCAAENDEVRG
jgi:SdpI/YfhL protein family